MVFEKLIFNSYILSTILFKIMAVSYKKYANIKKRAYKSIFSVIEKNIN